MGTTIEFNDTLKISTEQGFPSKLLNLKKHRQKAVRASELSTKVFSFKREGARVFHHAPIRCFLVEEIEGKWLYWGHILIIEQSIVGDAADNYYTTGKYKIIEIYEPEYQKQVTNHEAKKGSSYFET